MFPAAMNIFGGGDAPQPVEVVKESSGRGRGRVKLNAPAHILGSSCTVPQQQKPAATTPVSRGCGPLSNALPQLDAGRYWLQHSEAQRDSQMQKRSSLPSSVPAETAIMQQRQQAVNEVMGAEQPNSRSSQEKRDPVSTPSDRLSIIGKALTDPDSLNALQMQWLVFNICDGVTKDSNNAASAAEFCTSLIKRGRTSAFLDALVETCSEWFKRRELLLPRCTARTPAREPGGRSWTAYVAFLAELLAAVSGAESSAQNSGRIFSLAALLCECCHIMLRSPAQDAAAEIQCLRSLCMTAGKSIQRADAHLSAALAKCLRDSFMDSSRSADVRQALLELIELRASGWKLGAAQQRYYCAHDGGAAVTDGHSGCSGVAPLQ
ncbi:MIF4G domain-containing protein B-like [Dermacentor albipictus]|uniref:MIF4G domain-containing protein B-like n=1 Tax=Dermacentor albipictus TaxID=60249 RepID=UPI0038FC05DC